MGVDIYSLKTGAKRKICIGEGIREVGLIERLWKVTETGMRQSRIDTIEALEDAQKSQMTATPRAVMVEGAYIFGGRGEIRASLVLGWDRGRVKTQDYDWDHLPHLGWAVERSNALPVLHEEIDGRLTPITEARAKELGIIDTKGELAEHRLPTIAECRYVSVMSGTYYDAECVLDDGRIAHVVGETESGEIPEASWFVGRRTDRAASYRLTDQAAVKR